MKLFESIKREFQPLSLGAFPTPIKKVAPKLWVKDEAKINESYGGNKIRKLEFLLSKCKSLGKGSLLTIGALGSHHVYATALHGKNQGLDVYALLVPQEKNKYAEKYLLKNKSTCRKVLICPHILLTGFYYLYFYLWIFFKTKEFPYTVTQGGSNALGSIGWVLAAFEIYNQMGDKMPSKIVLPYGSGGTLAGLTLGFKLLGLHKVKVIGVRVVDVPILNEFMVKRLMKQTYKLIKRKIPSLDKVDFDNVKINHQYVGKGYARVDTSVEQLLEKATAAGLDLEPTYAVKAYAYVLEHQDEDILFIKTNN